MRVLMVVPWVGGASGGAAAATLMAARVMAARGHAVEVLATNAATPSNARGDGVLGADEIHAIEARLHPATLRLFPIDGPRRLAWSRPLDRALSAATAAADIVDVHGLWLRPVLAAASSAARTGTPYLVWPHGALSPAFRARGRVRKAVVGRLAQDRLLAGAAGFVVASRLEAEWLAGTASAVPRSTWRHPVAPSDRPMPVRAADREPILLWAGRLAPVKRPDLAIRLLAELPVALNLAIAGHDGSGMRPGLEMLAHELGVAGRVAWLGERTPQELRARMATAVLTLVSSDTENYSLVAAESLAEGTPVVVGPRVGIGELITERGGGLVVDGDAATWAAAIRELTGNSRAYATAVDAAAAAGATITPDAAARSLEALHAGVLVREAAA